MPDSLPALEAARDALAGSDFARARDALIAAWRERRSPALAALVDVLDARAPDGLSAALAALVTPRVDTTLANLQSLGDVDDPRLAGFAVDSLVRLPFTTKAAEGLLLLLVDTARRHDDPRLGARLAAITAAISTRIGTLAVRNAVLARASAAVAGCRAVRPATPAEAALEGELAKRCEPLRDTSAEALLAEIYARPDDDEPRLVYADRLMAANDPRGEFIALQLARAADHPPTPREAELLKKHGKAWLGDLAPVLSFGKGYSQTTFRRGFVADADVILSVGRKMRPLASHLAWATVERFIGGTPALRDLLATAPLRALRELPVAADDLAALAAREEPLAAVRLVHVGGPLPADALRRAFPHLQSVAAWVPEITPEEVATLATCGTECIELNSYWNGSMSAFEQGVDALVGAHAQAQRLRLYSPATRRTPPVLVELRAGADGRWTL